jgi:uncharacterized protein (TIGR02611 family)
MSKRRESSPGFVSGALKQARRLIVLVVGTTILAIGVAMIVLPGPAFVFIPAGLATLASEFVWARRLLDRVKAEISRQKDLRLGGKKRDASR